MRCGSRQARRGATRGLVAFLLAALWLAGPAGAQGASQAGQLTLPAGTRIDVALVRAVPAHTAKAGDALYGQTNYPVAVGDRIAIPAGTWVQGRIEAVTPPTRRHDRAVLDVLLTKIIFANNYVVSLPDAPPGMALPRDATEMRVTIQVRAANDLLLDNGAPIAMVLAAPLVLDAERVAQAIPLTHAAQPGALKSATMCRPTPGIPGSPGTPGTPDTVIPGTPGTPDTVIPGGPGMPDTVIPGTPATPDTVIPGTPGMPGTQGIPGSACPPAPIVVSSVPIAAAGNAAPVVNLPPAKPH